MSAVTATPRLELSNYRGTNSGRASMAAPSTPQPSWLDMILGSVLLAGVIPVIRDWWKNRVEGAASVQVAKISSRDSRIAALEERMDKREEEHQRDLEGIRRDHARDVAILREEAERDRTRLHKEQETLRNEIAAIALRLDGAIGGDPSELLIALREIVYELRILAGQDMPGRPAIISGPRKIGEPPLKRQADDNPTK